MLYENYIQVRKLNGGGGRKLALTKEIPEYVIAVSPTSYATELDADHAYHRARISFMQETSRVSIGQAASLASRQREVDLMNQKSNNGVMAWVARWFGK